MISKVDVPIPWCAGIVVAPKKDGKVRICVDMKPSRLLSSVKYIHCQKLVTQWHSFQEPDKVFSKLDANR